VVEGAQRPNWLSNCSINLGAGGAATLIEPGYHGLITLELANLGQIPLTLYPGQRIAQITFTTVEGDTSRVEASQFEMSFEPKQGRIAAEDDFVFIPDQPNHTT
jgi:dCTP deaminase